MTDLSIHQTGIFAVRGEVLLRAILMLSIYLLLKFQNLSRTISKLSSQVNSYMEKNPDTINLEWYHHMKCWKRFCDEEKIRRQQRKEEKGEGTSSKTVTSTEESHVEVEPISQ